MYSAENADLKRGSADNPTGLWLVDKPEGVSSFGVVARLRRVTGIKKVGHTGTLDPLATGLMVLLVGKDFTRLAQGLTKLDKVYEVTFQLGTTSTTDDEEGEKTVVSDRQPAMHEIEAAILELTGEIEQTPPIYSAIKIGGQRAYKLARRGEQPKLAPRPVKVYEWTEIEYAYPVLKATIAVGSGTYIRSLARDLGEKLGTGAYMTALRRTRVGDFQIAEAMTLDYLEKI
jgi:tRNA pseudouridine55 synthase